MTKIKSREKELFLNSAEHKPHYGIRKLTIGAASVLLSTTLFMGAKANIVKADTTDDGGGNSNITDTQNGLAEEAASDVASSSSSNSSSATQSVQSASQAATTEAAPTQSTPTTKISASTVNYNSQTNTQTQAPAQAPAQNSVSNQTSPVSAQLTVQAPAVDSTQSNAQANTAADNNQSAYDANAQANEAPVDNSTGYEATSGETAVNTESVEQPAADVSSTTNYQATINYHDLDDANNYINSQTAQINNSQNVIQAADDLSKYNVEIPDDIKYSSNSNSFTITNPTENSVIDVNLTHKHDLESITKTITRTIKFEGPAGMQLPKDHIDSLTFTGTKDTDLVTGHSKTSYDQQSQTFKDFKVPEIPGYTAKITTVRGVDITAESNNLVYTITYVKNETKKVALPSGSNDDQSAKTLVAKGEQQAQTSSDKEATKINFDPTTYIRSRLYSPRTAAQLSALPLRMSNKLSLFETNLAAMDDGTGDEETDDGDESEPSDESEETGDDDSGDDSYNDDDDDDDDYDDTSDDDDSDSETADGIPSDQQDNPNIDHTYIGPDGDSRVNPHQPSGEELYGGNDNTDGPGGTIAKGDQTKWPHITPTNPNYGGKNWINFLSKRVSRKITFYYLPDDSDDTSKATQVPNAMHTDSATFTRDAYINPKTGKPYIFTGWNHSKQLITFPQIDLQNTFLNVFEGNDYSPAFMTINGKKSEFNDTIISQVANPNSNNLDVRIYLHKGRAKIKVEIRDISENNRVLETHELMGAPGANAHFDASSQLDKYLKFGYNLSSNDFSQAVTFPQHANQEITHYVSLVHAIQTVNATDENPNPDNPSKNGTRKDMPNLSKSITRIIKYVVKGDDPNKPQAPKTVVQKVQYHRGITIDMVTGKPAHQDVSGNIVTEGGDVSKATDWKLDGNKSNSFEAVDTPQLDGYTADEDLVPQEMTSPSDKNQVVTITYTPNVQKKDITRTLQPKDENGNDIGEPVIPDSQHTTITKTGTGDFKPGTFPGVSRKDLPVIPGFHVTEDVPADPNATEDKTVPVHYHSNGKIIPIDPNGNQIPGASQPRFETDPNDPTKTVPGTPPTIAGYHPRQTTVNPDPTDPSKDVNVTYDPDETPGTITRVINYVDENGKPLQNPATQTVNVKKDKDGKVVPNDSGRYSYYQQRISPTINNYHLVDPSQKVIPGEEAKDNKTITVKYAKNGRVIPVDQSGKPIPGADTPTFPTDSRDPSKTIPTNKPDLTNKGYQPKDGNPQVSPDPHDPSKDVTVTYVPTTQKAQVTRTIHFVYENGQPADPDKVQTVDVTEDANGTIIDNPFKKYDSVTPRVIKGYVSSVPVVEQDDANGNKEVTVTYRKIGNIIPVDKDGSPIPNADKKPFDNDPNDPSKGVTTTVPTVPGKTPSQSTATPDPSDPTKDVTVPYLDTNKAGQVQRTIHYVYKDGGTARPDTVQTVNVTKNPQGQVVGEHDNYKAVKPPVINGYVSDVSEVPEADANGDKEVTVTYSKIGNIVPVDPTTHQPIPGAPTKQLDNDPDDPSKGKTTTVPAVPGKKPSQPTADPDPNDPTKDVDIPYTDNNTQGQVTRRIHYVYDTGTTAHDDTIQSVDVTKRPDGSVIDHGQTYGAVVPPVIKGYVSNVSQVPSESATKDDEVTVTYKKIGNIVPVDPKTNQPIPGAPTKPLDNDSNDPSKGIPTKVPDIKGKTPSKPTADPDPNDPSKDVNVPYTDNTTAGKVSRTIHYKFDNGKPAHDDTVQLVNVTKDSNGNVIDQGQTYDAVKPPVINGYVSNVSKVPSDKATSNKEYTVTYKEIGRIIPVDPKTNQPIPDAPTKPLDNDPDDPSKGKTTEVPTVPGKRPAKPTADPDPEDPSKDVKVPYTDSTSEVTRTIHYVYKDGGTAHEDTVQTVKVDLAPDGSIEDNGQTYDKVIPPVIKGYVSDVSQVPSNPATQSTEITVTYSKIGNVVPVDPNGNPIPGKEKPLNNDPNDPSKGTTTKVPDIPGKTPSKPTVDPDPKDPTKDVQVPYTDNNKQGKVSRTIHYVYSDGRKVKDDTVQTVDVTEDENGNVIKPGTYKAVKPDVINGYVSNVSEVPEETADKNKEVTITYTKVGNFKPKDPNGNPIPGASDQPYKNDPNDPSKVIPDEPVPNIPGYIPDTPTVTPKDPTKDTDVTYHKASDPVNIEFKFIDQDNNNQEIPDSHVKVTGENGNKHTYSPDTTLKQLENKGYELVSKDNGYDPNGNYTDNEKGHVYTYTLKHHISNINDDSTHKSITQTVHYVGGGNNKPEDNKQTIEFNRTGQKDDVTGKVTYGPWTPDNKSTTEVKVPVVKGYVADQGTVPSNTYKPTDSDKTITVNYSPIGNIVPTDPNGNKIPGVPNTPYTNDPNDASKVIPTPVPNIPGYKPNQSTVDPKDPTKDTNVTYTPIEQTKKITRTINYVFSDGKKAHDPTTQVITIHKIGNGPWQEGTYGSVVPPVIKGYTSNVGKIPSEKSTEDKSITVTYKKVGKIVPRDPNGNPIPGAPSVDYINDPNDPSKVIITKVPQIPGYTPSVNEVDPKDPNKDTIVTYTKNEKPLAKITGKDDTYHMPAQKSDKIGVSNGNYQMPAQKADKVSANDSNYQLPAQKATKAKLADTNYIIPKQSPAAQPVKPVDNDNHKATLPQTGNDDQNDKTYQLAGIGMLMAGITALGANDKHLARIAKRRANKRKNNSGSSINNGFVGNNTDSNVVQAASGNNAANELHKFTNSNNNSENTNTNVNSVNSNNNSAIVSNVNSSNNAVNANNNTVQALNNANSGSKKLPQTGNSSELEAGLGALLSGISIIGLAGAKKKRLD